MYKTKNIFELVTDQIDLISIQMDFRPTIVSQMKEMVVLGKSWNCQNIKGMSVCIPMGQWW